MSTYTDYAGTAADKRNHDGVKFAVYLRLADKCCLRNVGVSIFDLADWDWWTAWNECTPVEDAVQSLLEDEGYPVDAID